MKLQFQPASLALLAILGATGQAARADHVTINLTGAQDGRSAALSFVMDDAAGTMTVRVRNTMTGDGQAARSISGVFWSFGGAALDVRGPNANGAFSDASTGSLTPWAPVASVTSPSQLWAFHDPDNSASSWANSPAAHGASQGLGTLGLWRELSSSPLNAASLLGGDAASSELLAGGHRPSAGPEGALVSASSSRTDGARNEYRDYLEFRFEGLNSFFASYGGARNIQIFNASAQFGTGLGDPNVSLVMVPLPPAALAGLGTLAGLAAFRAVRRRTKA